MANLPGAKAQALAQVARLVDGITGGTKQLLVARGLEKQSTIDEWDATYQHYVPLQREGFGEMSGRGTGQGLSPQDADGVAREPLQWHVNPKTGLVEYRVNPALPGRDNVSGGDSTAGTSAGSPNGYGEAKLVLLTRRTFRPLRFLRRWQFFHATRGARCRRLD